MLCILLTELGAGNVCFVIQQTNHFNPMTERETEKESVDINQGSVVTSTMIDLDKYQDNVLIQKGGSYTLTDGGSIEYDACLYSTSDLIIEGKGTLIVNGQQADGEGIATEDANITIQSGLLQIIAQDDGLNAGGDQGGTVIALGTDMTEKPQATSIQKSISLTLDGTIQQGINMTLVCDYQEIISFQSTKSFRTVIISIPDLTENYQLYKQISHSEQLVNGIYQGGQYSGGILVE